MNPILFSLWLLVSYQQNGPYVVERFKDLQDCETFKTRIVAEASKFSNHYHMSCERTIVAR